MHRSITVIAALLLTACSSRTPVGDAFIGGLIIYSAVEYSRDPHPMPSLSSIYQFGDPPPSAPLAPDRVIVEQDCSQPIDLFKGNIRCK
jgi:hypothetical protein